MNDELDAILTQAAGGEPAPVVEDPVVTEDPVDPVNNDEPKEEPVVEDTPKETKKNPMKEVRDRLAVEQKAKEHIERTVQRFTEGDYNFKIRDFKTEDGKIDYDALNEAMDNADLKVKAESKGISPEVQAEIDRIEKEKIELQRERLRVSMDRAITNMQTDLGLKNDEIATFFKDSMTLKKNPYQWLAQGGTLKDLYYLVYRETLMKNEVDKAIEEAKAKWEASTNKKAPVTNPATTVTDKNTTSVTLDELLKSAIK